MWLSDFTLVLPDRLMERGSLRVEAGRIAEIADHPVEGGVAGDGLHLFPGLIDIHGDMIELEVAPRPGAELPMDLALGTLDDRLAAAGVTTAYASVSFSRGAVNGAPRSFEHTSRLIRAVRVSAGSCRIDHKVHARFDITFDRAVEVIADLVRDNMVDLVSLMDHTPGQGQYRDVERHIAQIASVDGIGEDAARARVMAQIAKRSGPEDVIIATLHKVAGLCRAAGIPLASHDDDTPSKVDLMATLGAVVSEFPVTMDAARQAHQNGMQIAMGAPNALRGVSYSGNLSARATHAEGLLSILAADYHPGTMLPSILVLAASDPGALPGAARLATVNPAKAMGLSDRGALAQGLRADLMVADCRGIGRSVACLSQGRLVYSDGTLGLGASGRAHAAA